MQLSAGGYAYYTVLRDSAHTNVAELFREKERRVTAESMTRHQPMRNSSLCTIAMMSCLMLRSLATNDST